MFRDQERSAFRQLPRRRFPEAKHADALFAIAKNQRSEIGIDRNNRAALPVRPFENGAIAGIGVALCDSDDVMPFVRNRRVTAPATQLSISSFMRSVGLGAGHARHTGKAPGIKQRGLDIRRLEEFELGQQFRLGHAGGEVVEQMLHRKAMPADDRLAAENAGVGGDAGEERVGHWWVIYH